MIETGAALRRAERHDDMMLTAAWLTASLQRAKKIPPLKKILTRDSGKTDIGLYLAGAKVALPKVSLRDWCARRRPPPTPQ